MPTAQDEGVTLTARSVMNFTGAGVTAADDSANSRTVVAIPGALGGSGSLTFTTGSATSNTVTVTHNRGQTGYAAVAVPTVMPAGATSVSVVILNKTATTFQAQGIVNPKLNVTFTFDWMLT